MVLDANEDAEMNGSLKPDPAELSLMAFLPAWLDVLFRSNGGGTFARTIPRPLELEEARVPSGVNEDSFVAGVTV